MSRKPAQRSKPKPSSKSKLPRVAPASVPDLAALRHAHEQTLCDVTAIPTAAGREQRVVEWIRAWTAQRNNLRLAFDRSGNMLITRRLARKGASRTPPRPPLFITAHLDHPGFVVREVIDAQNIELEFRSGVHDPYFSEAAIEVFDQHDQRHAARIRSLDPAAKPFKRVMARLERPTSAIAPGDVGRWLFEHEKGAVPRIEKGLLHTHACDDLAALAAALCAFDVLREVNVRGGGCEHVGLLFTRAEEVGFIGAIAACKHKSVPRKARLVCLENSRSFPHDSPIGAGPIVRVGDRMSVFEPTLTNQISLLMTQHQKDNPQFKYQRKLMPGGTCEATTFSTYGYRSTCLCLPLGNYHNMIDIDGVTGGTTRLARVGPEFISVEDFHGLIEMLVVCALRMDAEDDGGPPTLKGRMEGLFKEFGFVLDLK